MGSAWVFWGLALVSLAAAGLPHTLLCVRARRCPGRACLAAQRCAVAPDRVVLRLAGRGGRRVHSVEPVTRLHFLSAPVLAALAVDAACGVLAAAVANGLGVRLNMETFFIGCALAATLGHAVLVPGYVWAAGPLAPKTLMRALLMRTVVAGIALPCAVVVAAVVMVVLRLAAGRATSLDPTDTLALTASGIVVGLGAIGAQWVDGQPGRPRLPGWTHVTGAVAGLWLVLGATNLSGQVQGMPWARALLALATVVAAGLPHTLLAAWAAVREGHVFPAPAATKRRAAWCGATLGVAALGVAANAFLAEGL